MYPYYLDPQFAESTDVKSELTTYLAGRSIDLRTTLDDISGIREVKLTVNGTMFVREVSRDQISSFLSNRPILLQRFQKLNHALLSGTLLDFLSQYESDSSRTGRPYDPYELVYTSSGVRQRRRAGFKDEPLKCLELSYSVKSMPAETEGEYLIILEGSGVFQITGYEDQISTSTRIIQVSADGQILGTSFDNKIQYAHKVEVLLNKLAARAHYWNMVQKAIESRNWTIPMTGSGLEN